MALTIEECIKVVLAGDTGLDDIIDGRYYPMILPQVPTYPALTYTNISDVEHHDIDFAMPRFQFSCWAETYAEAKELKAQIKSIFQRRQEPMGGTSVLRIVQGVYEGAIDLYDPGTETYHIPVDFKIIYKVA